MPDSVHHLYVEMFHLELYKKIYWKCYPEKVQQLETRVGKFLIIFPLDFSFHLTWFLSPLKVASILILFLYFLSNSCPIHKCKWKQSQYSQNNIKKREQSNGEEINNHKKGNAAVNFWNVAPLAFVGCCLPFLLYWLLFDNVCCKENSFHCQLQVNLTSATKR